MIDRHLVHLSRFRELFLVQGEITIQIDQFDLYAVGMKHFARECFVVLL